MAYTDIGYDEFLNRIEPESVQNNAQSLDPQQFDNFTDQISGSKIQGGIMRSADGKVLLDLETGYFQVTNNAQQNVRLGLQDDGTFGFMVKDKDGNIIVRFTGDENYIRSPQGNIELNLNLVQFLVRDDTNIVKVLLGKDVGGF